MIIRNRGTVFWNNPCTILPSQQQHIRFLMAPHPSSLTLDTVNIFFFYFWPSCRGVEVSLHGFNLYFPNG